MSDVSNANKTPLTKQDFESKNEVRWCPGCGDYAILASVQKVLAKLNMKKENVVFVSGIGCSSRFPYYMSTYGFHTIHGRAPTIATGLKLARPELSVWVVTGDGDGLSIGANHLVHLMRRNINVNVLLINNQIYGLTKGQYSPTSDVGKVSKTTPLGSLDRPVNPLALALASECTFVGRGIDIDGPRLQEVLVQAALHQGTSFVEIYQNCNVFNDGAFASFSDRGLRDERTVFVQPGQKPIFGKDREKGIHYQHGKGLVECHSDQVIPYEENLSPGEAFAWAHLQDPIPVGVFRHVNAPVFEQEVCKQNKIDAKSMSDKQLLDLLQGDHGWEVN